MILLSLEIHKPSKESLGLGEFLGLSKLFSSSHELGSEINDKSPVIIAIYGKRSVREL